MSAVSPRERVGFSSMLVLIGCTLLPAYASAKSEHALMFFPAVSPAMDASLAVSGDVSRAATPVAGFMPLASATTINERIAHLEGAGDFYSPQLAELSEALGKTLQAEGEYRSALTAYDRSLQIRRRHEGLASTSQVALLRSEIECQVALGDVAATDLLHTALYAMQQQLFKDRPLALADAQLDFADWNLQYYLQAERALGAGSSTPAVDAELASRLADAFSQYHKALWLLSTAPDATQDASVNDRKVGIERKIAGLALMVDRQYQRNSPYTLTKMNQHSFIQDGMFHNPVLSRHGSEALQRAITYSAGADPVVIAQRQLELADWYLLMDQHDKAATTYAAALDSLRSAGVQEDRIAAIVESGQPVLGPDRAMSQLLGASQAPADFDGYIDVAVDVNRYGLASNARVLGGNADDAGVEADLLQQLRSGRFRPGFDQGVPVDRTDVTVRYYFAR
jgi:tetratricopeptide (TPR) repeat protein